MGRPWQEQNDLRQFSQRDPRHVLLTARRARCDFKTGQGSCDRSRGKSLAAVCGSGRFMSAACSRSYTGRWGVVASSRLRRRGKSGTAVQRAPHSRELLPEQRRVGARRRRRALLGLSPWRRRGSGSERKEQRHRASQGNGLFLRWARKKRGNSKRIDGCTVKTLVRDEVRARTGADACVEV